MLGEIKDSEAMSGEDGNSRSGKATGHIAFGFEGQVVRLKIAMPTNA
jgi:hypothetical protein